MKAIKGTYRNGNYFEYMVGKMTYHIQGELYWNRSKNRLEHIHEGVRGGPYILAILVAKNFLLKIF